MRFLSYALLLAATTSIVGQAQQTADGVPKTARVLVDSAPAGIRDSDIAQIKNYYPNPQDPDARAKQEYFRWVEQQLERLRPIPIDTRVTNKTDKDREFRFFVGTNVRDISLRIPAGQTQIFRFWASPVGGSPHIEYYPADGSQRTVTKLLETRVAYEFVEDGDLVWLSNKGPIDAYKISVRNTTADAITVYGTECSGRGWPYSKKLAANGGSVTFEMRPGPDCDEPKINFNKGKWSPNSWTYGAQFGAVYEIQAGDVDGKVGRVMKLLSGPADGEETRLRPDHLRPAN